MSKQTKDLARRFYEAYSAGDTNALEAIVSPDFVGHQNSDLNAIAGLDALKRHVASAKSSMNNVYTIEDIIAEGDKVVVRYVMEGKIAQPLLNNPSTVGKPFKVRGCAIFRVADGKLAERWMTVDQFGWLRQSGAVPNA
ncbi:MAG: ester cyclase [Chloroflexi bacterium]|nr:ester cyclase [Chloroflexota bacterium]